MSAESVFIPLIIFGSIAAVIIVPQVLKSRDRQQMYETMRAAYDKGQPVPTEFVDAMNRRATPRDLEPMAYAPYVRPPAERDLRRGVVWTAIGLGFLAMGLIGYLANYGAGWSDGRDWFNSFAFLAAIPLCVGLAFLALWAFSRGKPETPKP